MFLVVKLLPRVVFRPEVETRTKALCLYNMYKCINKNLLEADRTFFKKARGEGLVTTYSILHNLSTPRPIPRLFGDVANRCLEYRNEFRDLAIVRKIALARVLID